MGDYAEMMGLPSGLELMDTIVKGIGQQPSVIISDAAYERTQRGTKVYPASYSIDKEQNNKQVNQKQTGMSKLIGVVGQTGSGKSTSIKTMDPKETYIINVAGKELPFKGSEKLYNRDNKNYKVVESPKEILELLQKLSKDVPEIKNIIIEDANYIMGFDLVSKATETGYTKFSVLAKNMVNLIQESKKLRDDLIIYYFSHPEEVEDAGEIVSYKMKTAGKMIDNQIVMEGLFTVVLYTHVESKGEKTEYSFLTNRFLKWPAKSPQGMFSSVKIPNDLAEVTKAIREYYS